MSRALLLCWELWHRFYFCGFSQLVLKEKKACVLGGGLSEPELRHLVLSLSILVHFRWMRTSFKAQKLFEEKLWDSIWDSIFQPHCPSFFPLPRIGGTDGFTEGTAVTESQLLSGEKKKPFDGVPSLPIMLVVSRSFPNLCSTGEEMPCRVTALTSNTRNWNTSFLFS